MSFRSEFQITRFWRDVFVSPLAKLAFQLCVLGDTGLKTGWVRCGWDLVQKSFLASVIARLVCVCPVCNQIRAYPKVT